MIAFKFKPEVRGILYRFYKSLFLIAIKISTYDHMQLLLAAQDSF